MKRAHARFEFFPDVNRKILHQLFCLPPTLEKLKGHIAFGRVRPSVRPSVRAVVKIH